MIHYTIYKDTTGEIVFTGIALKEEEVINITASGQSYILEPSKEYQYVANGTITDMPPKPDGEYRFNYVSKSWEFNEASARTQAIYKRDQLLKEGPDRINPLWWGSMTAQQQQSWSTYRQDLLDITQQPGYPAEVTWPVKPE